MTATTSRRAIMAGAAALGTASAVNLAAIVATRAAPDVADAELIAIGAEFDRLVLAHEAALEREAPSQEAWRRALAELPRGITEEQCHEWHREVVLRIDRDFPVIRPSVDDIANAMDAPMRRIMALPATTLAGLAVKAHIARHACCYFYDESDERADWDHLIARNLIDAVLALGKVAS